MDVNSSSDRIPPAPRQRSWPSAAGTAAFAATMLLLLAVPAAAQQIPAFDVKERILDNGLRVLVLERPNHPSRVGARVFYQSDMAGERPGTAGLTHALEHHLFKGSHFLGTRDWEGEREVAERVERSAREMEDEKNRLQECFRQRDVFEELERECRTARLDELTARYQAAIREQEERFTISQPDRTAYMAAGATGLTASTGRDWMKYHADLPANRLEAFMWIERSRTDNPVFRQFDPEMEVVIEQIRRAFNRADAGFNRALRSMTYEANPYGWAHWFSDLEGATREDHWEIFYKFFIPQNTTIVVVGDITADEVFALSERYWGDWPPSRPAPRLRTVEPPSAGQKRLDVEAAAAPVFALNVATPAIGHPDHPALEVLAELLGGRTGLLMRRTGQELGLATAASASMWTSKFPSHFGITVGARDNDHLERLESEVLAVLREIAEGRASSADVAGAAKALSFSLAEGFEDPGDAAVILGSYAAIHDWRYVNELPALWSAVTPDDLARVTTRYFGPDDRIIGTLRRARPAAAPVSQAEDAGGYDVFAQARPGSWPAGGAVEEFAQPLPARVPHAAARLFSETGNGEPAEPAPARWATAPPLEEPEPGQPLPVAENPWHVPPWMAVRRGVLAERPSTRPLRITDIVYPEAPQFYPPDPAPHRIRSPGGMATFVVTESFVPLVRASLMLDISPLDDPAGKEGLSELAVELLLESGGGGLTGDQVRARLDELGVTIRRAPAEGRSLITDEHRARIDLHGPSAALQDVLRVLGDVVVRTRHDQASFQRIQARLASRAAAADDEPTPTLNRSFATALYGPGHPLARSPSRASVEAITYADVVRVLEQTLVGARVGLAVSGDAARADVERWVRGSFQGLRTGSRPQRAALPAPRPTGEKLITADREAVQAFALMGYPTFTGMPADHAAYELMHYILGGAGQGGHMFQLLRTRLGLTAAAYVEADPRSRGPATFEVRFAGHPRTLAEAVRQTCGELDRVRREGLTREEFERAKVAYLEGHVPSVYRTPHHVALRFLEKELLGRFDYIRTNYLNYYAGDRQQIDAIRRLTLEDVNRAARTHIRPDDVVTAVVGPLDAIQAGSEFTSGRLATCSEVLR
jgi:predicted Zn-dependent peptidase